MIDSILKAFQSPLLNLGAMIFTLGWFFPWIGVCFLGLFLILLVTSPHRIPTPLLNEIALADLILRARLSRAWASLNQGWWHEILPGLYLGGIPLIHYCHLAELKGKGIQAVYAVLEDHEAALQTFLGSPLQEKDWDQAGVSYVRIRCQDMQPLSLQQLEEASEWIHLQRCVGKTLYIHCKNGRGRSPMVMMAYLMRYHHLSLVEAQSLVLQRPVVRFRPLQRQRMEEFEQLLKKMNSSPSNFQKNNRPA